MGDYETFIAISRYARYLPDKKRRETWEETVDRYFDFLKRELAFPEEYMYIRDMVLNREVFPSMRALMTAGKALERDHVAGYNCSYLPVDHPRAFDEAMYILLCGTGVGFSVERQYINKLPEVPDEFHGTDTVIKVRDSKIGWASGLRELISLLYSGRIPRWDTSAVRPAGAPLKTFGGRASGPEPLERLFKRASELFQGAAGRRLTSIECHDLMCEIGKTVVVGGVRRSAMISLSNLSDDRMRHAKSGQWWLENDQRSLANNSVCYTEKPDFDSFLREWVSLYESKSGERGIFNRQAAKNKCESIGRDPDHEFGTNPCSEIILRPYQFCNLTEVIVRPGDTLKTLTAKVEAATILGTYQATLTNFRYLRKKWRENCEEERLLGVSLSGIMDNEYLTADDVEDLLGDLRDVALKTNRRVSKQLGINQSTAITCVKPSGTVSQLANCASGIHPRYSSYYIRRVRQDVKDPLTRFLIDQGVPYEVDAMNPENMVFSFPMKAPEEAITRNDWTAIDTLEHWKAVADGWCDHKPSITVYYRPSEFLEVGQWVWDNFDELSGVSFLPHSDHSYQQAPYEEIDEETYNMLASKFPTIDWLAMPEENHDTTTGVQEYACVGGACEL